MKVYLKFTKLFIVFVICFMQNITSAQPLRIDLVTGVKAGSDLLTGSGAFAYGGVGVIFETKVSYKLKNFIISPVLHLHHHTHIFGLPDAEYTRTAVMKSSGYIIDLGIEKSISLSYSKLNLSGGIGYNWEDYHVEIPYKPSVTFTNNDIIYWSGLSLYLPFIKGLDVTFGYRLVLKKSQIIKKETSYYYNQLETASVNHLFMFGVSFSLLDNNKKK